MQLLEIRALRRKASTAERRGLLLRGALLLHLLLHLPLHLLPHLLLLPRLLLLLTFQFRPLFFGEDTLDLGLHDRRQSCHFTAHFTQFARDFTDPRFVEIGPSFLLKFRLEGLRLRLQFLELRRDFVHDSADFSFLFIAEAHHLRETVDFIGLLAAGAPRGVHLPKKGSGQSGECEELDYGFYFHSA